MENPFYYGGTADKKHFANRQKEIKELCSTLSNSQNNVIIFSPRRYGKTSLIKRVLTILKEKGVLTFYIDVYAATTKKKFIEIYARAIAREIEKDLSKALKLIKDLLPRTIPTVRVKPEGLPEFEFDFKGTARNIQGILENVYEAIPKYAKQKKKKAVVVFDEFQEILNLEDEQVERTLRSHIQHHQNVSYVFMGSKKHLMVKLFNDASRPFYKSGGFFPIYKISKEDFRPFIISKFKETKINITNDVANKILEITENHPYYTQFLCSVLWDHCVGEDSVSMKNLDLALTETISRATATYIELWENLTNLQRRLLSAFATQGSSNIYSQDFILENELGTPSSIQRCVKALIQKGIIEKENSHYIFSDIFFKKWLSQL